MLLLVVPALAACSGLNENERLAAENISASLEQEYGDVTVAQADCTAEDWVEQIGLEKLQKAEMIGDRLTVLNNVRDATLSKPDAEKAAVAFEECGEFDVLVADIVADLFDADDTQRGCIEAKVTKNAAEAWAVSDLQGGVGDNVFVLAGRQCMSTPERDAAAVATLTESLNSGKGLDQAQAACVAAGLVEQIGTHELVAAEVLTEDLKIPPTVPGTVMNLTDATIAADVTAECVPREVMLAQPIQKAPPELVATVRTCLTDAIDQKAYVAYLVGSYMGRTNLPDESVQELADCLRPALEEIAKKPRG